MKILFAGILALAAFTTLHAQIVTLHGTVIESETIDGHVFDLHYTLLPGLHEGDSVTQTFTMTHSYGLVNPFGGGEGIYDYDALATLSAGSIGMVFSNQAAKFDIQDISQGWGLDSVSQDSTGFYNATVELWSTNLSVLNNHFLVSESGGAIFDRMWTGAYFDALYVPRIVWKIDSVDVSSAASPVPEPSTFGYVGAAALITLASLRRKSARRHSRNPAD